MSARRMHLRTTVMVGLACFMVAAERQAAASREPLPEPPPPAGGTTTGVDNCGTASPGFVPTWEKDANTLLNKLLLGGTQGVPPGVEIRGVTVTPGSGDIAANESIGHYESFLLQSPHPVLGQITLALPDGIMLTTGDFIDKDDKHVERCNDTTHWSGMDGTAVNNDPGDQDIQELYAAQIRPPSYDASR